MWSRFSRRLIWAICANACDNDHLSNRLSIGFSLFFSNRIRNDPQQIYCYSTDEFFFVHFVPPLFFLKKKKKHQNLFHQRIDCRLNNFSAFSIELVLNKRKKASTKKYDKTEWKKLIGLSLENTRRLLRMRASIQFKTVQITRGMVFFSFLATNLNCMLKYSIITFY